MRLDSPGGDGVERGTRSWGHTSTHSHRSLVQGCSQERSFLGTSSLPCTCLCFSGRRKSSGKGNWSNRPYGWGTYSICHTDAPFTSQLIHEQVTSTATNECQALHVPMHSHKHQYFHMPAHSGGVIDLLGLDKEFRDIKVYKMETCGPSPYKFSIELPLG